MLILRSTLLKNFPEEPDFSALKQLLPFDTLEGLEKQQPQKQKMSLLGWHMLYECLMEAGRPLELLKTVVKEKDGKPVFESSEIHFNITHAASLAACALSTDGPVGVDVEKIRAINAERLSSKFSEAERRYLQELNFDNNEFLRLWTRKEATMKLFGKSIFYGLEVDVREDNVQTPFGAATLQIIKLPFDFVGHYAQKA